VRDDLTHPSGLLLEAIYGIDEVNFDAESAEWSWGSSRCTEGPLGMVEAGEGRAYITRTTLLRALGDDPGADAIVELLGERVARDAWSENARFEVLTRVTDDGERYLFALNPSPEERLTDRVLVSGEVSAATDVSVEGGFPVPVTQQGDLAAIDVSLGAGEMAVLWGR